MKELYLTHINEAMNALISANNIPGLKGNSNSVYIVNYMQNNVFAQGYTDDFKMRHMITRDPDDRKLKMISVDNQDEYGFDNSTDIKGVYKVLDKAGLSEALEKIESNLGNEVNEGFIYECILGDKMYTWDQIEFNDKVEKIVPYDELIKGMNESIRNYTLYGKEKAELISEIKYGDKNLSTIIKEYKNTLLNESEDKSKNTYKLCTKYKRPYTYEEIVKYYGQEIADKLKKDPIHKWRMDTGIELIHKEPTLDELNRIWKNWNYMTDDMKRESDRKSKELFNMDNITHYKELIKTYYLDEIKYENKDLLLNESKDKSKLTKDYKKNSVPYRVIDIHNDECYKYFDKEEIDWYRNANRQGEILVETRCHSAIGYIYTRKLKNGDIVPGPFKVFDYYKGMGFGEILLKDAINKFGVNTLNVFIDNKVAIALYKKVGFRILETRVDKNNEKYYIMKL